MISRILFLITTCSTEPLGIMYLSSTLRKQGYIVRLKKYINDDQLDSDISMFCPDIVCLSMTTGQHVALLKIAKTIKDWFPHIKIIIGGAHPTYFPQVGDHEYIDYMLRGEADVSFPALLNKLNSAQPIKLNKDQSDLILPTDLDSLPFPDRDIISSFPEFADCRMKNVMTSRGCPFNCTYCYVPAFRELYKGQKIVRYRSAANVVAECEDLKKNYAAEMIFFIDDEFSMNVDRLYKMQHPYRNKVGLPFHCQVRIDLLDMERVDLLKDMGCHSITFAIESGDEDMRKSVLGRRVTDEQILSGIKLLHDAKIPFRAENMAGLPQETFEQMNKTLNLNIKAKPAYAWCSIYQPYPGTKLGDYCIENGLFDGRIDLINEKFTENSVLNMSDNDRNRLLNWQRLFSLVVEFPVLKHILPLLLTIRGKVWYTKIRDWWKIYCYKNRLFNLIPKEIPFL